MADNLVQSLQARAVEKDKGVCFIQASGEELFLSYGDLYSAALARLVYLRQCGLARGDELVFQLEDNRSLLINFWACLIGGIIAVPLSLGKNDEHRKKLFAVWNCLKRPYLTATAETRARIAANAKKCGWDLSGMEDRWIDSTAMTEGSPVVPAMDLIAGHIVSADDIAFIQFSSGSTGDPKGVTLTHGNLIANIRGIGEASGYSAMDSMLSWMPLTHDMGLIGFHLSPLYHGMMHYLIGTDVFVRMPGIWLTKAGEHHVTILCSPNFGYSYLLRHWHGAESSDIDLSCVRILYNGAEPISVRLYEAFLNRFSEHGLSPVSMCPVYGLAEASLAVTISPPAAPAAQLEIDRRQMRPGDAIVADAGGVGSVAVVNVGSPVNCCRVRITDDAGCVYGDGIVGHIEIAGPCVTAGYYNNSEATVKVFREDGWLSTGDLGFFHDGSLYVTGRAKDILFVNGENYYPHDIERVAEEVEGVELNKIVVAGFFDERSQREEVVVFLLHRGTAERFLRVSTSIRTLINNRFGLWIERIIPVDDIPRTTSGKLQRYKLVELWKAGRFADLETGIGAMASAGSGSLAAVHQGQEAILAELWRDILGMAPEDRDTGFFESGGTSLRAAEFEMRAASALRVVLPAGILYRYPTIGSLAAAIGRLKQGYEDLPAAPVAASYALSLVQRRLYAIWELDNDSLAYNMPVAFSITGPLDIVRLESCIKELVAKHDALRMHILPGQHPRLKISEKADTAFECLECPGAEAEGRLSDLIRPFDLGQAPLFRIKLLKTAPEEFLLFADFHHIATDGLSIHAFFRDLLDLYAGRKTPEPRIGFKDYCHWEIGKDLANAYKEAEAFWAKELDGELPVLNMPMDHQRPAVFETAGGQLSFAIGDERVKGLKALAASRGESLHTLLLAVYAVLLSKYSGQEELIIGIPESGRTHPDVLAVHGMFVNNLPMRLSLGGDETFDTLLKQVGAKIKAAVLHRDLPFGRMMEMIVGKREVSRSPIFDTMFVYQQFEPLKQADKTLRVERVPVAAEASKFDVSLLVTVEEEGIQFQIEYRTALWRRDTVGVMGRKLLTLIDQIVGDPSLPISELSLLEKEEAQHYIRTWNRRLREYPQDLPIHKLIALQAKKTPESVAIEYGDTSISYGDLEWQAETMAAYLAGRGVGAGAIVAVFLDRSPELIISLLAVLKTGAAYLPVGTDLPSGRISYLLADSGCRMLITSAAFRQVVGTIEFRPSSGILFMEDYLDAIPSGGTAEHAYLPGRDAYVIYTSGTTGRPKGVVIGHRALVNYITWAADNYLHDLEAAGFPFFTSVAFDLTVTSLFCPLVAGGRIVIYPQQADPDLMAVMITENKADVLKLTPSHLKWIRDSPHILPDVQYRLRRLIVGGERFDSHLAKAVHRKLGGRVDICNEYGPTEATVGCMIHRFDPAEKHSSVGIGVPIANMRIYLLDSYLKPVPENVYGEIYIAGDGLASGYLGKEELTAASFLPDPFCPGERMYRTKDIGRRHTDGCFEFIGRSDNQVKINGYRIETAEIEQCLSRHDQVREAVVLTRIEKGNQPLLAAYYRADAPVREAALRTFLAGHLPVYMIPAYFIFLPVFPLTKNGKVDHEQLAAVTPIEMDHGRANVRTALEEIFIGVWKEILGVGEIGLADNFFGLGGDSIKAFQAASRLTEQGVDVQARDILVYQTIEQIIACGDLSLTASIVEQGPVQGSKALSPIEEWFFRNAFVNPGYYNQTILLKLSRRVEEERMALLFTGLVRHHDGLRMNYDAATGKLFYNPVHLTAAFRVGSLELAGDVDPAGLYGSGDVIADPGLAALRRGFDLSGELLIRATLIGKGIDQFLFICAHHLVIDAVSWRILLEDLYNAFVAMEQGKPINFIRKTASLAAWRENLARYCGSSQEGSEQGIQQRWKAGGLVRIRRTMSREATVLLSKEAQRNMKITIPVLLNFAVAVSLSEWTGRREMTIEQEYHGRYPDVADVSRTVGWFTCMYPLEINLPKEPIEEQLWYIRDLLKKATDDGLAYSVRKYLCAPAGSPPVAGIRLNYLGEMDRELNNALFNFDPASTGLDTDPENALTARWDINALISGGKLIIELNYHREDLSPAEAGDLLDRIIAQLGRVAGHLRRSGDGYRDAAGLDTVSLDQADLDELFS